MERKNNTIQSNYYLRSDVVAIARSLLGKFLMTSEEGRITGGIIVETEAYSWKEKGCHAYNGKKTTRNEVMFEDGGRAYVYLCYGVHNLFNVVTNKKGFAEAVLVRAIEPVYGVAIMQSRRNIFKDTIQLTSGPGKLTCALGIDRSFNGKNLWNDEIWIEDNGRKLTSGQIQVTKRIGIDYAGTDANLPWRFMIKGNKYISR